MGRGPASKEPPLRRWPSRWCSRRLAGSFSRAPRRDGGAGAPFRSLFRNCGERQTCPHELNPGSVPLSADTPSEKPRSSFLLTPLDFSSTSIASVLLSEPGFSSVTADAIGSSSTGPYLLVPESATLRSLQLSGCGKETAKDLE